MINKADLVDKSFRKFMHSVNLECEQELGLSVYDLYDLDYRAHYEALSIQPTWAEWDSAVQYCVEDIKAENGMDW